MIDPIYSYGLLALELSPGHGIDKAQLSVAEAGALGELMASDLRQWIAPHADIDISLAGACFDPVEILRPEWPVHRELARLSRLLSMGADAGNMPEGLQPNPDFQSGPMRLIPFVLSGPAASISAVQDRIETDLMERGMAGAGTALAAQGLFGAVIEHARYMTLHDLVALMAMQYGHNGLEPLWPIIETALFAPHKDVWLDAAPEPLIFLKANIAHIAMLDSHQWAQMQTDINGKDCEQLERQFQMFQMRQRQVAALLEAHGIEVNFDFCPDARTARETLQR
jgi:hypothetical protein